MLRNVLVLSLTAAAVLTASAFARQDKPQASARDEVNATYAKKLRELDTQHLLDLAKVAAAEKGDAADASYRLLFNLAIARNLYGPVEKAAEAVIDAKTHSPDVEMLAQFVNIVAEADRGSVDESLEHLKSYIKPREGANDARLQIEPETVLAVGEAYFQRLVQYGRYDAAQKLCEFVIANSPREVAKAHFGKRLARLGLLGKPAPTLEGTDLDGKKISLADYKGKVVLVDFWATWCPPCSAQMIRLNTLRDHFKDQGFEVLGVNVDSLRQGAGTTESVLPVVRRYVLDHQARFPILVGTTEPNLANAYGVEEIPANFLIDRSGNIIQFELGEGNAVKAVEAALKK
jgi:peroxiredoxin